MWRRQQCAQPLAVQSLQPQPRLTRTPLSSRESARRSCSASSLSPSPDYPHPPPLTRTPLSSRDSARRSRSARPRARSAGERPSRSAGQGRLVYACGGGEGVAGIARAHTPLHAPAWQGNLPLCARPLRRRQPQVEWMRYLTCDWRRPVKGQLAPGKAGGSVQARAPRSARPWGQCTW